MKPEKILIWVIVAIVVILALIMGYNYMKKKSEEPGSAPNDAAKDAKELEKRMNPTYQSSQYSSFADSIHQALKQGSFASSWEDSASTAEGILLAMKNDLDVAKLIDVYGKRPEYYFGIPGRKQTLFETISSNFSKSRVGRVNQAWKANGITFQI